MHFWMNLVHSSLISFSFFAKETGINVFAAITLVDASASNKSILSPLMQSKAVSASHPLTLMSTIRVLLDNLSASFSPAAVAAAEKNRVARIMEVSIVDLFIDKNSLVSVD